MRERILGHVFSHASSQEIREEQKERERIVGHVFSHASPQDIIEQKGKRKRHTSIRSTCQLSTRDHVDLKQEEQRELTIGDLHLYRHDEAELGLCEVGLHFDEGRVVRRSPADHPYPHHRARLVRRHLPHFLGRKPH